MGHPSVDLVSMRFGSDRRTMPPLGPLQLVARLEQDGIPCTLVDVQSQPEMGPFALEDFRRLLRSLSGSVLALSVFNDALPLLVAGLNGLGPEDRLDRKIVVGGPGVVGVADALLGSCPAIDVVVVGEGEDVISAVVERDDTPEGPGVFSRDAAGQVRGEGRTARVDLGLHPGAAWDWCRGRSYSVAPLLTATGCPFDCTFCEVITFLGRKVKFRSLAQVEVELERALEVLETDRVAILDDTLTVNHKHVHALCRALADRGRSVLFSCYSRTDTIDEDLMQALASAGCTRIFFGLDAGSQRILDRISKRLDLEAAIERIRQALAFCDVTVSMIWGYPFETLEDLEQTRRVVDRVSSLAGEYRSSVQLHLLSPGVGTPLFTEWGQALVLDADCDLLPLTGAVGNHRHAGGFEEVLGVIEENRIVGAPFYRYATSEFDAKRRVVEEIQAQQEARLGAELVRMVEERRCS